MFYNIFFPLKSIQFKSVHIHSLHWASSYSLQLVCSNVDYDQLLLPCSCDTRAIINGKFVDNIKLTDSKTCRHYCYDYMVLRALRYCFTSYVVWCDISSNIPINKAPNDTTRCWIAQNLNMIGWTSAKLAINKF